MSYVFENANLSEEIIGVASLKVARKGPALLLMFSKFICRSTRAVQGCSVEILSVLLCNNHVTV